ncbi:MAG: response regulator [Planctomycetota bacterium]|nr:response regulator [Planctomycetota bacterium]
MSLPRPSVLLVDDEPRTLEVLGALLDRSGFAVTLASAPGPAVELLRSSRFDAVVTDVVFDGWSEGALVLGAAREHQPDAVVILMTGYPALEAAVAAVKQGATDYLQKPVDPVVLAAYLHRALREREMTSPALAFKDLVDIMTAMVANTIERVDPYTAGHGSRTRKYCRLMGTRLGLDASTRERLELAGIAHDYGKIYLDDLGFLTKKGPLTPEEYAAVQKHPELGARKLGHHPQLKDVCRYVAEHHEKWDGTGYPKKTAGEDISLPGRILGCVEVFDSLATKRSYKEGWELTRVIEFLKGERGKHFDPVVIDEFLVLLAENGEDWLKAPQRDREAAGVVVPS